MSKGNKLILGLALGAVAGAALGVLFAPKSGKETRADLKKQCDKLGKKLGEFGQHMENAAEGAKQGFAKEIPPQN